VTSRHATHWFEGILATLATVPAQDSTDDRGG
jgi:hypothetical protein